MMRLGIIMRTVGMTAGRHYMRDLLYLRSEVDSLRHELVMSTPPREKSIEVLIHVSDFLYRLDTLMKEAVRA